MILRSNLSRIRAIASGGARVLDVGGWYQPFNLATHVIDLGSFETRHAAAALDPEDAERFSAETWAVHDVCVAPWPYPDKYFDFVFCSHLLEDVRDPLVVCRELVRVARAGYVETPSRLREIYAKERFGALKFLRARVPEIGFHHHRWFVEAEDNRLKFTAKTAALTERRDYYLTRSDVGRKLTAEESGLGLFWRDEFTAEEVFADPRTEYPAFRRRAMAQLKRGRP